MTRLSSHLSAMRPSAVPSHLGTPHEPIMIDDEDDIECSGTNLYDVITIDEDDDDVDESVDNTTGDVEFISEQGPVVDDEYRWGSPRPPRPQKPKKRKQKPLVVYEPRVKPVTNASFIRGHFITDSFWLVPGDVVELREDPSAPFKCGDFLKIVSIYEDAQSVYLRGLLYRRARTLEGMLPRKLNEVYQVLQQNLEDTRSIEVQSLHDVSVSLVIRTRCLKHTNAPFPDNSFRTLEDMHGQSSEFVQDHAQLTCRWKRIFQYTSAVDLMTGHQQMQSVQRLTDAECDKGLRVPDILLRRAVPKIESDLSVIDLTAEEAADQTSQQLSSMLNKTHISTPNADTALTFGDYYCGAGGVSVGAREAGFKVVYGVDHDHDACETYRRNFPNAEVFEEDMNRFLTTKLLGNAHVRCVHMSTVCKTLSCAYTVRGKNHDANEATLFTISDILRKATPMVATLEQTSGALNQGKKQLFGSFVLQFTALNYSVKWVSHIFSEYGVPQARKRLIMIAACPGHPLPNFPKPTHAVTPGSLIPGLRPSVTIADALRPIRRGTPNHKPAALTAGNFAPYSADQLLRGCITTSGGQNNWHPSGKRPLTEREYACLQTFPLDHVFKGVRSSIVRQVGNAVPPAFSQKLFASIRKTFEEVDKMDRENAGVIQLDDDEEMTDDGRIVVDLT